MSLLNFPSNPAPGDLYTIGSNTWQWNGTAWIKYNSGIANANTITVTTVITVTSGTNSTSTTTGGIVVNGGVGIAQDLYVGGHLYVQNTDNSVSTNTGAVVISGGVGIAKDVHIGGDLTIYGSGSTSTVTYQAGPDYGLGYFVADGDGSPNGVLNFSSLYGGALVAALPDDPVGTSYTIIFGSSVVNTFVTTSAWYTISGGWQVDGTWGVFNVSSQTPINYITFETELPLISTNVGDINSISTTTGAIVVNGGIGISGNANVQGRVTSESLRIAESVFDSTQTSVNTTATTIIDTYSVSQYRGAKYLIQVDEGTGPGASFSFSEMLLLVDNDNVVTKVEYAYLDTDGVLGTFAAGVVDGNLELYFIPSAATSKVINVLRTAMIK